MSRSARPWQDHEKMRTREAIGREASQPEASSAGSDARSNRTREAIGRSLSARGCFSRIGREKQSDARSNRTREAIGREKRSEGTPLAPTPMAASAPGRRVGRLPNGGRIFWFVHFKPREPGNASPLQFIACEFRRQTRICSRRTAGEAAGEPRPRSMQPPEPGGPPPTRRRWAPADSERARPVSKRSLWKSRDGRPVEGGLFGSCPCQNTGRSPPSIGRPSRLLCSALHTKGSALLRRAF